MPLKQQKAASPAGDWRLGRKSLFMGGRGFYDSVFAARSKRKPDVRAMAGKNRANRL
jgi:hypothetical protein